MDRKRRRTGAIAHSHANGNCDTDGDGFGHAELNSTSDSSGTAASDTRASPDTLSSVAGSRTVILAREGISAAGAWLNQVHTVLLNRSASPHISLVTGLLPFYCSG
jgi:hypothetical protein